MDTINIKDLEARLIKNQHLNSDSVRVLDAKSANLVDVYSTLTNYLQILDNLEFFGYNTLEEKQSVVEEIKLNIPQNENDFYHKLAKSAFEVSLMNIEFPELKQDFQDINFNLDVQKNPLIKELFDVVYSGDLEKINESSRTGLIQEGLSMFKDTSKKIEDVYYAALKTREFKRTKNILTQINPDVYESIIRDLSELDISKIGRTEVISFNKVYDVEDKSGKNIIVKITKNAHKAKIESAANYYLSRDKKLGGIIVSSDIPEPLQLGEFYITLQDKVDENKNYDAYYYVSALAMLHSHGKNVLKNKVFIPEYESKDFDEIMDDISRKENSSAYSRLKGYYSEVSQEFKEMNNKVLIHSDAKTDNLSKGKILDLENIKFGNPAIDLSLYFVESGIPKNDWAKYAQVYSDVLRNETSVPYGAQDVSRLVENIEKAAVLTTLKELGGLYSREMGKKEKMQAELLKNYIRTAA